MVENRPVGTDDSKTSEAEIAEHLDGERLGGLKSNQIRVLAEIAEHHRGMLHEGVLANVAILWAHHLKVLKQEIVRRCETPRSMMYEELPRTQEFIEKLRTDAQLDQTDEGEVLACNLCGGEFTTESSERKATYPAMYRHWQSIHGWCPKAKGTPPRSDEYLDELRGGPAHKWLEAGRTSAARAEVETMRSEYPEAFKGDSGELLERALEEIAQSADDQYHKLYDDIQRRNEQRAALAEISNHRNQESMHRLFRAMAIAEAKQFQVAAPKIGEVIGKTAKTVRKMRSEGQETTEAFKRFFESTIGLAPVDPAARTGLEVISEQNEYYKVTYSLDDVVTVSCSSCDTRVTGDLSGQAWTERLMYRHWMAMHSQPVGRFASKPTRAYLHGRAYAAQETRRIEDPVQWLMKAAEES